MQAKFVFLCFVLFVKMNAAIAGGGATGGATEFTQILNNVQLADSYATQTLQLTSELNREQIMIKNALANPLGVTLPDVQRLATDVGRMQSAGAAIGNNMAQVDANFAARFNNPLALTYSDKFKAANNGSMSAIQESMQTAGLQRENFSSDTAAVTSLTDALVASQGTQGALQALGAINAAQLNDSIKTRDLLSSQQLATNNWMAEQSKHQTDQASEIASKSLPPPDPIPDLTNDPNTTLDVKIIK